MHHVSCLAACLTMIASVATAAPVGFTFNAGPVTFIETGFVDPEVAVLQNFVLGENVFVSFTIESTVPDLDPVIGRAEYEDPTGSLTLTGARSGTVLEILTGVNVQFDSQFEFDLRSIATGPVFHQFELFDDIDFETTGLLINAPDDLGASIADLSAALSPQNTFVPGNVALASSAAVGVEDSLGPFVALEFGPVATVPVPASGAVLVGALGVAVGLQRRKRPCLGADANT